MSYQTEKNANNFIVLLPSFFYTLYKKLFRPIFTMLYCLIILASSSFAQAACGNYTHCNSLHPIDFKLSPRNLPDDRMVFEFDFYQFSNSLTSLPTMHFSPIVIATIDGHYISAKLVDIEFKTGPTLYPALGNSYQYWLAQMTRYAYRLEWDQDDVDGISLPSSYLLQLDISAGAQRFMHTEYLEYQKPCEDLFSWEFNSQKCLAYCRLETPALKEDICTVPDDTKEAIQQCNVNIPTARANPILISDGTKIQYEMPDIKGVGAFPLIFSRSYNSQQSPEAQELRQNVIKSLPDVDKSQWVKHVQPKNYTKLPVQLATRLAPLLVNNTRVAGYKNWSHNYSGLLKDFTSSVRLSSNQFANRTFAQQLDGSYKPNNLTSDTLTRITDGEGHLVHWIYRSVDNQFEYYNALGLLTQRINRAGLSQHLEYDANDHLERVYDDANNQLFFNIDEQGKLLTLTSSQGELITYGYDQYANLETVTKKLASGKETVRSYHYEDSRHPYALTGITDENGARYVTWEYDAIGRAVVSKHAGDADNTTFEFANNKTTVTNPLGKQTIYNYAQIAGAKRLETVEGVASTSCLAANQNYEYYTDGQLKSKTDWKGIKTEFFYNARGLETQRIEAVGTTEQRITTTTWHVTFNLPITITAGEQVTTFSYDSKGLLTAKSVTKI